MSLQILYSNQWCMSAYVFTGVSTERVVKFLNIYWAIRWEMYLSVVLIYISFIMNESETE